ncbi:hypothetical protein CHGG_01971 [Chaetomium globosum CBS 148.51]|uniref:Exonuclease domain-containing protein n=1 Tax=Chaetomium globosum (strain ATCC 6205 / CBS 148.51 / DSM 1962 / NBRC 6347 / NRRL 1970) TaxID=306901 RepID=Q2HCT3_CHAGB|nr:uncharacterized protein CHGG_01971 [Chaetomium globosum CBS 148.51]EAQ93736.1 hypothetical protein CHGG_01971 [Chaetomium globosum CBS 148.51]
MPTANHATESSNLNRAFSSTRKIPRLTSNFPESPRGQFILIQRHGQFHRLASTLRRNNDLIFPSRLFNIPAHSALPPLTAPSPPQGQRNPPFSITPPSATIPQPPQATPTPTPATTGTAPAPPRLTHRGITYTTLTPAQQTALHPLLLARCHTRKRLSIEGYDLDPRPPATIAPPPRDPHNNNNPPRHHHTAAAAAVVLDCEMAGTSAGDYPIAVSVVDFFTGAVLVDALVRPGAGVVVQDWRSGITGIGAARIADAGRAGSGDGEPLAGREGAREAVLRFVDGETVVVGQAVRFDLRALGIVHGRVVDSAVLAAEASGRFGGVAGGGGVHRKIKWWAGLEELCRELLGMRIRGGEGQSHDSLEDVLATRELVLWCLENPDQLKAWAAMRWGVKAKKGWRTPQGRKGDSGRNKNWWTWAQRTYGHDSDDDQMLRWEDVVDYACWPKSPPDWSD